MLKMDEKLAAAVQVYRVIYDKTHSGYKDKIACENAWRKVVVDTKLEDVKTAKRLFGNLKKRYLKRKRAFKSVNVSGTSKRKVTKERKALEEYSFMSWLDKYVSSRESKSNISFKEMSRRTEVERDDSSSDDAKSNGHDDDDDDDESDDDVDDDDADEDENDVDDDFTGLGNEIDKKSDDDEMVNQVEKTGQYIF